MTMKVPPVEGWRATSPRERENVERSSWAYFFYFISVSNADVVDLMVV